MSISLRGLILSSVGATALSWACAGAAGAADYIILKDGTRLEGEIMEEQRAEVIFNNGIKSMPVLKSQLRKQFKDLAIRNDYQRQVGEIKANFAEGHFKVYLWCKENRLYSLAEKQLDEVIKADPNHAKAREALGYLYRDGKWLTLEEAEKESSPGEQVVVAGATSAMVSGQGIEKAGGANAERRAYQEKVVGWARTLGQAGASEQDRQAALVGLVQDRTQASAVLLGCLDARRVPEEETRLGALKGLKVAPHPSETSKTLAYAAVFDPSRKVQDAAVALIKERKDDPAVFGIMRHLVQAYEKEGYETNEAPRVAGVRALQAVNDPRVYEGLLYYVVMEMRPTVTELVNFATRQIDSFTINQGAAVSVLLPLSFPIQFPELRITRVRTTVCGPAAALHALTGQDFETAGEWIKWIRSRKQ